MRTRPRATSSDLRLAVACLPRHAREAMLTGILGNPIIVGAYATGDGICPMLAAHRNGGRTHFIGFANTWDRFASRDGRRGRTRRATERELSVLRAHLEASLLDDHAPLSDLAAARAEHVGLVRERERNEAHAREPTEAHARERNEAHARERTDERRRQPANELQSKREARPSRPGDPDRRFELNSRPGWSWSRLVRRYDDYERLLEHLDRESTRVAGHEPVAAGPQSRR